MSALSDFVCNTVWALHRPVYESLEGIVRRHADGVRISDDEIAAITAARDSRAQRQLPGGYENRDGVGVVPISGVIARHASQVNGISSPRGTSVEAIRNDLRAALSDPDAHSIMLAIDSPGGSVDGIIDIGDEIRAARKQKPVVAHVAGMAASAGYWLASQAGKVFATRGSSVGSIGVISTVVDTHRRLEQAGVDVRYVTSVEGKAVAPQGQAVTHRDLSKVQAEVDAWHERFVDAVAAGRNVGRDVAAKWGDARMHFAEQAHQLGLIDGVRGEDAVIESLRQRGRAAAQPTRGTAMAERSEGAPAPVAEIQPRASVPTSARDLRDAYPEAVAQIERTAADAAVSAERARVSAIASACEGQSAGVVAVALAAIAAGTDATATLSAMLRAAPRAEVSAPVSQTVVAATPTIDQVRAAAAQNAPLGTPAPAAKTKRTTKEWREVWAGMERGERDEFMNEQSLFLAFKDQQGEVI